MVATIARAATGLNICEGTASLTCKKALASSRMSLDEAG